MSNVSLDKCADRFDHDRHEGDAFGLVEHAAKCAYHDAVYHENFRRSELDHDLFAEWLSTTPTILYVKIV